MKPRRKYINGNERKWLPVGTILPHPCPECGDQMTLQRSRKGYMYACVRYPACKGTHSAHLDGHPMGRPANAETKQLRHRCHEYFDRLWNTGDMSRDEAYLWLRRVMSMRKEEAHIGNFTKEDCEKLIAVFEKGI